MSVLKVLLYVSDIICSPHEMASQGEAHVQARKERDEKRKARLQAELASKSEKKDDKVGFSRSWSVPATIPSRASY